MIEEDTVNNNRKASGYKVVILKNIIKQFGVKKNTKWKNRQRIFRYC